MTACRIEAAALEPGDQIYSLNGDYGTVETVAIVSQPQVMYNLTVDEAHTFFVGTGAWLAHNCSPPAPGEIIPGRFAGDPRDILGSVSPVAGIYEYRDQTRNWYVGKAGDLYTRMGDHLLPDDPHVLASVEEFVFTPIPFNQSARSLEIAETIRVLQLRYMGYEVNNDGLIAKGLWPRMREQLRRLTPQQQQEWPLWLLRWEAIEEFR